MRETSDLYKTLLADPAHIKESRLTIAGVVYDESQIVSLSTDEPLFAEDCMSAGGAVAREIDFVAFLDENVPRRAEIIPEVRLVLGDQTSEWLQKGVFYIDTRSKDPITGVTTVHGFDAMLMGEQEWVPEDTDVFPMPMEEATGKLLAILGVELDPRTTFKSGDVYMVDYPVTGQTIRQTLRWIAAAHGANWITNDLGQFRMVPLNALPAETGYLVTETGNPITFGGVRILVSESTAGSDNPAGGKVFVGQRAAGVEVIPAMQPISRIILKVDDENAYVSESDTDGLTLEISCAYGSQQMADDLFKQLEGYVYQPMQAEDALIDPASELGDGVTVNGVYTILAQKNTIWDMLFAADIAAPGEAEIESEYVFTSSMVAEFNYKLAQTRSLISKTAEEIRMEVAGVEDEISYIQLDLESITSRVQDAEGNISTLEQTATELRSEIDGKIDGAAAQSLIDQSLESIVLEVSSANGSTTFTLTADGVELSAKTLSLSVDAVNITGKLTASQIDATNLKVAAANITGTLTLDQMASISFSDLSDSESILNEINDAYAMAEDAEAAAADAVDTVDGWRYNGGTYIDSSMIMVTTLMATELLGGYVGLLTSAEKQAGGIDITGSSSSSFAIELWSEAALRLCAYGSYASIYLEADGAAALGIQTVGSLGYNVTVNRSLIPSDTGLYCGRASYKWEAVYAETETIQTSDANKKTNIEELPEKYIAMFDLLTPKRAKMANGTSGRYHPCYIAQEVKAAMDAAGIDSLEFGGWVKDVDEDGNELYMLRYGEFDAVRDAKIKQHDSRFDKLEARVAALEGVNV